MTGRFGKYGDLKRKAKLRRSRIERNRLDQMRQRSRGRRIPDKVKPCSPSKPRIEVEITEEEPITPISKPGRDHQH